MHAQFVFTVRKFSFRWLLIWFFLTREGKKTSAFQFKSTFSVLFFDHPEKKNELALFIRQGLLYANVQTNFREHVIHCHFERNYSILEQYWIQFVKQNSWGLYVKVFCFVDNARLSWNQECCQNRFKARLNFSLSPCFCDQELGQKAVWMVWLEKQDIHIQSPLLLFFDFEYCSSTVSY